MPGWVIEYGDLRRREPWEDVSAPPSIRTAAIAAPPPRVYAVAVAGKWPRPENVEAIRRAVDAIPPRFLRAWIASGGRLEIVPGSNASIHPRFSSSKPALGWTKFGTAFCVVAGDHADSSLTATHELGHALDFALRYPSHSAAWMRIWQADVAAGKVSAYTGQRDQAAEYFAEQFGNLWHPDIFIVSKAAQDFIMQLV